MGTVREAHFPQRQGVLNEYATQGSCYRNRHTRSRNDCRRRARSGDTSARHNITIGHVRPARREIRRADGEAPGRTARQAGADAGTGSCMASVHGQDAGHGAHAFRRPSCRAADCAGARRTEGVVPAGRTATGSQPCAADQGVLCRSLTRTAKDLRQPVQGPPSSFRPSLTVAGKPLAGIRHCPSLSIGNAQTIESTGSRAGSNDECRGAVIRRTTQ